MNREVGVQSFTYREYDVSEIGGELKETDVTAIELCHEHVTPDNDAERVDSVREQLAEDGLDVCGYGVVAFDDGDDEASIRETFAMVDRLGGDYCSLEFPPDATELRDTLLSVAEEFDLQLAIHNHGPDATYSTVEDVAEVLDAAQDPRLGACVDTGHFFRSGESPEEVIPRLGDSVLALHLKDFVDAETEAVPGTGQLDIGQLLELLDRETALAQPLVIEYEADPDNPTPAVLEAAERVEQAME